MQAVWTLQMNETQLLNNYFGSFGSCGRNCPYKLSINMSILKPPTWSQYFDVETLSHISNPISNFVFSNHRIQAQ